MKKSLAAFVLSLCAAASLTAQTTSLTGTVADPTGAIIPNATVNVVNADTGLKREDKSDSQGRYTMESLPPGTYRLTASAPGFSDAVIPSVRLYVNTPGTANVVFEKLGSTSTTVAVEAYAAQINTVDATLGNAITADAIVELPSFARNVATLLQLQPGVLSFGGTDDRNGSVNGGCASHRIRWKSSAAPPPTAMPARAALPAPTSRW
jgi:Carboxypeptidase regulatory-like domain